MVEYYKGLTERYPLISIEDGLDEFTSNDLTTLSLKQIKAKLQTMIGLDDATMLEWKNQINDLAKRRAANVSAAPAQEAEIPDDEVSDVDKKGQEFEDEEMAEEVQDD